MQIASVRFVPHLWCIRESFCRSVLKFRSCMELLVPTIITPEVTRFYRETSFFPSSNLILIPLVITELRPSDFLFRFYEWKLNESLYFLWPDCSSGLSAVQLASRCCHWAWSKTDVTDWNQSHNENIHFHSFILDIWMIHKLDGGAYIFSTTICLYYFSYCLEDSFLPWT